MTEGLEHWRLTICNAVGRRPGEFGGRTCLPLRCRELWHLAAAGVITFIILRIMHEFFRIGPCLTT